MTGVGIYAVWLFFWMMVYCYATLTSEYVTMSLDPNSCIRIDITGLPCSGKSTVTAVIADALKDAFAGCTVEVQSGDGDFQLQYDRLHDGDVRRMRAGKIVLRDLNYPFCDPTINVESHVHVFQVSQVQSEET
jgi:hypothetical protein